MKYFGMVCMKCGKMNKVSAFDIKDAENIFRHMVVCYPGHHLNFPSNYDKSKDLREISQKMLQSSFF